MTKGPVVRLQTQYRFELDGSLDVRLLMVLLAALDKVGNLAAAAKICELSYRHAWGMVRKAEKALGVALIETSRRQGSKLTEFARELLHKYRQTETKAALYLDELQQQLNQSVQALYAGQHHILRLHASHGFAVEGLMRSLSATPRDFAIELHYRTGIEALAFLQRGECEVAGFQIPVGRFQAATLAHYQEHLNVGQMMLVYLAQRNVGLFVQSGNPLAITGMADLLRPDVRVVNRQPGSGSRHLMRLMIEEQDLDADLILNYGHTEFTHMAVAAHIASGMADVGFGIETAAKRCGLDFISLGQERYFFAFPTDIVNSAVIEQFLALLRSAEYKQYMQQLVGYESTGIGTLYTLKDAFADDLQF